MKIAKVQGLAHLRDICGSTVPPISPAALDDIISLYNITYRSDTAILHKRLSKLLTEYQFGMTLEAAGEDFRSRVTGQSELSVLPVSVRTFRIRFGNPFTGVNHNVAHHCVDLIYVYDCFHADLQDKDRVEEASATRQPGCASNAQLVTAMQEDWIGFICNDAVNVGDDFTTVYEVDRNAYRKSMSEGDDGWADRILRLNRLKSHRQHLQLLDRAIRALE